MHFLDVRTGWVASGGGSIFRTTDGGETWDLMHDDPALYFRSIQFVDAHKGWVGNLDSERPLLQTNDGGSTWSTVTTLPEPRPIAICGLWRVSSQLIFGVGAYSGPARLIKSTDGGATWTSRDLGPLATTAIDVYFKDASEGFISGGIGTFPSGTQAVILHTTDGGETWQQRFVGTRLAEWTWKFSFPTPSVGYASIERFTGPMHVLKTVDGGLTWSELVFPNSREQGVGFATPTLGWIGGGSGPASTFGTDTGGGTWFSTPWGTSINRFQFLGPTYGFASGTTVYRYSDASVSAPAPGRPSAKPLAAPNPFVSRTTIRFTLTRGEHVRLYVTDPAGRVVRTIEEAPRGAGAHVVEWDGRLDGGAPAPPGIYLYVLHAGEQHEMGKLVRVR